jgi:hypothetical protein
MRPKPIHRTSTTDARLWRNLVVGCAPALVCDRRAQARDHTKARAAGQLGSGSNVGGA